jgi:DNA adenine methylase
MRYLGGKTRTAKKIAQLISDTASAFGKIIYWEPFLGGGSVACAVAALAPFTSYYASDAHPTLIALWQALQAKSIELPSTVSEAEYRSAVELSDDNPLKAFIGFGCSFGGKYCFTSYARGEGRNYAQEAKNSLEKAAAKLKDFEVFRCDFTNRINYVSLSQIDGLGADLWEGRCVIYCDIPYSGVTQYNGVAPFNRKTFLAEAISLSYLGNKVLVSEYQLDDPHFSEVLTIDSKQDLQGKAGKRKTVERVYLCNAGQPLPTLPLYNRLTEATW